MKDKSIEQLAQKAFPVGQQSGFTNEQKWMNEARHNKIQGFIAGYQQAQQEPKWVSELSSKLKSQLEAYKNRHKNETWKDAQTYYIGGIDAITNAIRLLEALTKPTTSPNGSQK